MTTIELCRNLEWFAEHAPWFAWFEGDEQATEDLFTIVTEKICTKLWDMGFEVAYPGQGRGNGIHAWDGAVMRWKCGPVGTFADLSPQEKTGIEGAVDSAYKESIQEAWENERRISPSQLLELAEQAYQLASHITCSYDDGLWPDLSELSRNEQITFVADIESAISYLQDTLDNRIPDAVKYAYMREPDA